MLARTRLRCAQPSHNTSAAALAQPAARFAQRRYGPFAIAAATRFTAEFLRKTDIFTWRENEPASAAAENFRALLLLLLAPSPGRAPRRAAAHESGRACVKTQFVDSSCAARWMTHRSSSAPAQRALACSEIIFRRREKSLAHARFWRCGRSSGELCSAPTSCAARASASRLRACRRARRSTMALTASSA